MTWEGDLEEALGRWPKPVVHALEYPRDSAHACRVGPDDGSGGRLAARYLLERGHKRIGFVRWPDHSRIYRKRYEGYRAELEAWGHESEAVAFELLRDADRLKASGCTGFVCGNEVIAAQVKHLFAGAEVVAIGYLDRENKPAWKDFAVVGHPLALCMEKAVDLLIERVEHGGDEAKEVTTAYRVCPPEGSEPS
ncbi:MAG: LacI family transcriptional regulator [Lentisphaerae bacterium]|nr:MAG: LacI family transcriptional regulator [Lentisphaerota bacterium]